MLVAQQTRVRWFLKIDSLSQVLTHVLSCLTLSFHSLLPLVRIQRSHPVTIVISLCCVYYKCLPPAPSCLVSLPVHSPWLLLSCFLGTDVVRWELVLRTCLLHRGSCFPTRTQQHVLDTHPVILVSVHLEQDTILFNKTKQKVQKLFVCLCPGSCRDIISTCYHPH